MNSLSKMSLECWQRSSSVRARSFWPVDFAETPRASRPHILTAESPGSVSVWLPSIAGELRQAAKALGAVGHVHSSVFLLDILGEYCADTQNEQRCCKYQSTECPRQHPALLLACTHLASLFLSGINEQSLGSHAKAPWFVRLRVQIPNAGRPGMNPYSALW